MGLRFSFQQKDRGWSALVAALKPIKDADVRVGFRDSGDTDGPSNAQIAAWQEFGTKDGRIPERSFIRSTFDAQKIKYTNLLHKYAQAIYDGALTVERVLNLMGLHITTDIKKRVTTGAQVPPPNAPSVLARKEGKRRDSTKRKAGERGKNKTSVRTLIDTSQMIGALTWIVTIGGRLLKEDQEHHNPVRAALAKRRPESDASTTITTGEGDGSGGGGGGGGGAAKKKKGSAAKPSSAKPEGQPKIPRFIKLGKTIPRKR